MVPFTHCHVGGTTQVTLRYLSNGLFLPHEWLALPTLAIGHLDGPGHGEREHKATPFTCAKTMRLGWSAASNRLRDQFCHITLLKYVLSTLDVPQKTIDDYFDITRSISLNSLRERSSNWGCGGRLGCNLARKSRFQGENGGHLFGFRSVFCLLNFNTDDAGDAGSASPASSALPGTY